MAAPSFIQASTGATDATGAFTFTGVATGDIGNVVIVHIGIDGSGAIDWGTISGTNIESLAAVNNTWTEIGAFFSGAAVQQRLFIGRRTSASSAPTFTTTANTSGNDVYGRMYEFANVSTGTTLAEVIENGTAGSTTTSGATASGTIADASVTVLGSDRLALNLVAINDDNAVAAFTGMTGGTWGEAVAEYADSGGTDASIQLQAAWPSSLAAPISPQSSTAVIQGDGGASTEQAAQEFTTVGALTVSNVMLTCKKTGSPADDLVIEIQTDSAGIPSGTVVGSAGALPAANIDSTTTYKAYRVALSASLAATTTYHLVLRRSGARDTSNYFQAWIGGDTITGGVEVKGGGTWTNATNNDLVFALQADGDLLSGAVIDGGTATNVDAADTWAVVGFALIGTTVPDVVVYVPRHPAHDFGAITPN